MFIQNATCMDEKMSYIFNDLKRKNGELTFRVRELQQKLQDEASRLVREYSDSLFLPDQFWKDSRGESRPYVQVGLLENAREFVPKQLARLHVDEKHVLRFVIATTIDDNPITGGKLYCNSIALWFEGTQLYASVAQGNEHLIYGVSQKPGGFSEVCGAISSVIYKALNDAMPSWQREL